jgi:hypothetical protein
VSHTALTISANVIEVDFGDDRGAALLDVGNFGMQRLEKSTVRLDHFFFVLRLHQGLLQDRKPLV